MRIPVVLCPLILAVATFPALGGPEATPSPYARTILYQPHIPRCGSDMIVAWGSVPDATGYDLQVSVDGGWTNWKTNVQGTSAVYTVKPGEMPRFRIRALGARHVSGWERPVTPTAAGAVVDITSPEPGLHAQRKTQILLTANAPEDACGIREIAWMLDGREIARAAKPPYRHVLTCPVLGRHQIVATATMTDGSTRDSAPLPFRITRDWNERWQNLTAVVVGPGAEASLPPEKSRRIKPVKSAGKGQLLKIYMSQADIGAPPGGVIDECVEVVTSDGFPPDHQVLSLPLDTGVGTDAEMRRARMYRYDAKARAWRMVKGATLDEEKMTLSAPITEQGYYCLAAPPEEPKAPDVWWLSPAEGETVSGKTRLLVAGRGLHKGSASVAFRLVRLDIEKVIMVTEGTGSYVGEFGDSMSLDRRSVEEIQRALSPRGTRPETEDQIFSQDLLVDLSAFTPGRYRLVAEASPFEALSSSAARTITISSNVKAPTVTVDVKPRRSTDPRMGYTLTGTIKPGTLGNSYTSDGGVFLFAGGMLIGATPTRKPDAGPPTCSECSPPGRST